MEIASLDYFHEIFKLENMICFEAWAKLAQQRLVCVLLGMHLEPINKQLLTICPKRKLQCRIRSLSVAKVPYQSCLWF